MKNILHITTAREWEQSLHNGFHVAESLKTQGFIHLSLVHQILGVANHHFRDTPEALVILVVDEDSVKSEVKYEGAEGNLFPHIYGPLNLDAIIEVLDFRRERDHFILPLSLLPKV